MVARSKSIGASIQVKFDVGIVIALGGDHFVGDFHRRAITRPASGDSGAGGNLFRLGDDEDGFLAW